MNKIISIIEKLKDGHRQKNFRKKYLEDNRLVNLVEYKGNIYLSVEGRPVINISDLNKERDVTDILKDCRNVLSNFLRMSV